MQVNRRNNHEKEYISFFCPNKKNKDECSAKEINLNHLQEYVLWQLSQNIFSNKSIEQFIDDYPSLNEKKIKTIKKTDTSIKK